MSWYHGFLIVGGFILLVATGLFRPANKISKIGVIAGILVFLPGIIGLLVAISNSP